MFNIVALSLGVSADAFAVALARGLSLKKEAVKLGVILGLAFGVAQSAMTTIGWLTGAGLEPLISSWDHWVVFGLLAIVGCRMIYEALVSKAGEPQPKGLPINEILILAFATSIDALAVGIGLAFMGLPPLITIIAIGITTALISFLGVMLGSRVNAKFSSIAEVIGGLILIAIGVSILIEHLGN